MVTTSRRPCAGHSGRSSSAAPSPPSGQPAKRPPGFGGPAAPTSSVRRARGSSP